MQAKLVCFKPDGQRKDVPLTTSTIVFGRRDDCDVRVALGPVSRRHCSVIVEDDTVTVKDLDSSNGTFVNGRRITEQALKAGDQLQVGGVTFIVQIDGQPADIKPPRGHRGAPHGRGASRNRALAGRHRHRHGAGG